VERIECLVQELLLVRPSMPLPVEAQPFGPLLGHVLEPAPKYVPVGGRQSCRSVRATTASEASS
jgi:hypothetical protein